MLLPYYMEGGLEAGCDEAGRGCLAGPVFAAAVVLPPAADFPGLRDSKKLSETERDILRHRIEREALAWAVGRVEPEEIDAINILQASFLAMHRALDQLGETPDRILVDGNRFVPYREVPHHTFVKGDDRYLSIAAASILAKTHRDACMVELDGAFPHYGWHRNKGYPTLTHRRAIREHGPSCHHRQSFRLLPVGEAQE